MAKTQRKRIRQAVVGFKAPEAAAWKAGVPVRLADIKPDDILVCNIAGGVFCTVVSLSDMQALVEMANGERAWRFPAMLRRPAGAQS